MVHSYVNPEVHSDIDYWQLVSRLESGRAEVLRRVAEGAELAEVMNLLCEKAEVYNPAMMCSVLRLDNEQGTLHPLASVSLPQDYCDALEGVVIGIGVGSCGTAAFSKKRTIVEDINTHPYWAQYKELALSAGLQACWSEPIIGKEGRVLGTFAMYYDKPKAPVEEDLKFIETSANLAAVVFEHIETQQQLKQANERLNQTVDERSNQLESINLELSELLAKQELENRRSVHSERALLTKKLLSGFAHEVNTPIGISTTSASFAGETAKQLIADIESGNLTKNGALASLNSILESVKLCEEGLSKTANLIAQFREIDIEATQNMGNQYCMAEFLEDLRAATLNRSCNLILEFESEVGVQCHSKTALWQILIQLIDNSIEHGFKGAGAGTISIHVARNDKGTVINYQDNGCGVAKELLGDVFEPFYSTERESGKVGLGLNVIHNTVTNVFHGQVKLVDVPVGTRCEIFIPDEISN